MAHEESSKTRQGGLDDTATNYEKLGRMYQTDDRNNEFNALRLYNSKLNPVCNAFFSSRSDSGGGQKKQYGLKIDVLAQTSPEG